jgi:alpha,alpha-trehalase
MHRHEPLISDYGVIGNGQSAALVNRGGSIDWCCWPRFDSPAVFCRILDSAKGGSFRVAPVGDAQIARQYIPATNVLESTFTTTDGVIRLTDLMPAPFDDAGRRRYRHRILRLVEGIRGSVDVEVLFAPTFEYAQRTPEFTVSDQGAIAFGEGEALSLATSVKLVEQAQHLIGRLQLAAGERHWMILTHCPASRAEEFLQVQPDDAEEELEETIVYWTDWAEKCQYDGPYRDLVLRSALVLKLLVFQPSGGLIAAPTTSLPDEVGGSRNWDYRYTWLRDTGLVLDALQRLGYHDESVNFIEWLQNLGAGSDDLRVIYTVEGKPAPTERSLEHLVGYRGSRPVRIGNGAVEQTQVDVYGHILDAVLLCFERMPREMPGELWDLLQSLADQASAKWREPDQGPWEMRGPARDYLYSKLYCWVGLDRAIRFAEEHDLEGNVGEWTRQRHALKQEILSHGYNENLAAFTQTLDGEQLDASLLTIPLTGLLPADDERMRSTVRRIQQELSDDGLVYRYRMGDGLPGRDATFTLCSFWLVMNLALMGELEEATRLFERICDFANDLGLMSEQIDAQSGELLGNHPQGFTHLGLIRAAIHLQDASRSRRD